MILLFQNIFNGITTFDLVILVVFAVLFLLRLLYLFLFTGKILYTKAESDNVATENPLSLIFTIRNEEENLKKNLPKLLAIDKVDFEVVAVDDFSQDSSFLVLGLLKERYKRLKISTLNQETRYSMKLSQNIALKAAENNWIIQVPVSLSEISEEWLTAFSKAINNDRDVVVGYSGITESKGIFNLLFRIENYFLQIKSTGFILNRMPFVYSEENVAFRKDKYFEIGGYGQNINEPYANLELLINSFIKHQTTTVLFDKESMVCKEEKVTRKEYFELLKKGTQIEKNLSFYKRVLLASEEVTKLLFMPLAALLIVLQIQLWPLIFGLLVVKSLANAFVMKLTQSRLNESKIYVSSLVYDLIMPYFKLIYKWHFKRKCRNKRWKSKV